MYSALYKYYGQLTRDDFEEMDLIEYDNALTVAFTAGMPDALTEKIFTKKTDEDFVNNYIRFKQRGG